MQSAPQLAVYPETPPPGLPADLHDDWIQLAHPDQDPRDTAGPSVAELLTLFRRLADAEDRAEHAQRFKTWTHQFLDSHGVPHHPPGPHGPEGCRIGDRMDWLMARLADAEARAGMAGLLADVAAFHRATDTPILDQPTYPRSARIGLRMTLIAEEDRETADALHHGSLPEIAKELTDLIYVAVGTALEFGIPLAEVWDAVQASNMAKIDPATGKFVRRSDGKTMKPEGWQPPDVAGILARAAAQDQPAPIGTNSHGKR